MLAFTLHGPVLDEAIAELGAHAAAALHRLEARAGRARRRRLPDHLRREEGAVAAPTAGLHFTPELMQALAARGVALAPVTLHVGAGTFLPVKADDTPSTPHARRVGRHRADDRRRAQRRARRGRPHRRGRHHLAAAARERGGRRRHDSRRLRGDTAIFITPGYRFKAVDLLMTNFHLPRSTLFMLVSAFAGLDTMQRGLCARHRQRLSLLLLWRRVPVCSPERVRDHETVARIRTSRSLLAQRTARRAPGG